MSKTKSSVPDIQKVRKGYGDKIKTKEFINDCKGGIE